MKKGLVLAVFAATIILEVCCTDLKKKVLPVFNVKIPPISLTIPPIPFISKTEVPVGALKTPVNMDSTIRANTAGAFGASSVTTVTVKKIVIKVLNPDVKNNLSNFESGRIRIYSNNNSSVTDIANIAFPHTYADSIVIANENSSDISNYLRGSELAYNLYWKNRKTTNKHLKLNVKVTLGVQ